MTKPANTTVQAIAALQKIEAVVDAVEIRVPATSKGAAVSDYPHLSEETLGAGHSLPPALAAAAKENSILRAEAFKAKFRNFDRNINPTSQNAQVADYEPGAAGVLRMEDRPVDRKAYFTTPRGKVEKSSNAEMDTTLGGAWTDLVEANALTDKTPMLAK